MDEQIKQIAERLKGLRDALDLSIEEVAADCNFTVEEYQAIESGECDFSVSVLQRIARKYGHFGLKRRAVGGPRRNHTQVACTHQ